MDFSLSKILKNNESLWLNGIFYLLWALLITLVFTYSVILIKIYLQSQKINELNKIMMDSGSYRDRSDERTVLGFKKKIDDFSLILSNHKITSNVFDFIEKNTVPKVWFLNFDMSQPANQINLSGEAEDMETLSRQIQVFEKNKDYIDKIKVFSSQVEPSGKINFVISVTLNPGIF